MATHAQQTPGDVENTIKWDTKISPALREHVRNLYTIPPVFLAHLQPSSNDSIYAALQVRTPSISTSKSTLPLTAYFSAEPPTASTLDHILGRLRNLPIPCTKVVNQLNTLSRQAWLDGSRSVLYAHVDQSTVTRFPLWVITHWKAVVDQQPTRQRWTQVTDWLAGEMMGTRRPSRAARARDLRAELESVPWRAKQMGMSNDQPLDEVASRLLGARYLSTRILDNVLHLLRLRVVNDLTLAHRVRVEDINTSTAIVDAYEHRLDYGTVKKYQWLRNLGMDIFAHQQRVITIAHLGSLTDSADDPQLHWVALVLDAKDQTLRFGDPLGRSMPQKLQDAYEWFVSQHSDAVFDVKDLRIAQQQDGHSCGPLAYNACVHEIFPDEEPLCDARDVPSLRMTMFSMICERTAATAVPDAGEEAVRGELEREFDDFEFTFRCDSGRHTDSAPLPTAGNAAESGTTRSHGWDADLAPVSKRARRNSASKEARAPLSMFLPDDHVFPTLPSSPTAPPPSSPPSSPLPAVVGPAGLQPDDQHTDVTSQHHAPTALKGQKPIAASGSRKLTGAIIKMRDGERTQPALKRKAGGNGTLHDWFSKETLEDRQERYAREADLSRETFEARQQEELDEKAAVRARHLENARRRQQEWRDRKKAEKEANEEVEGSSSSRKRVSEFEWPEREILTPDGQKRELVDHDRSGSGDLNVAEASRSARKIRAADKEKNKKRTGRPSNKVKKAAVRTNWHAPFLWESIQEAADRVPGVKWSQKEIWVETQKNVNLKGLRQQVIGKWIEKGERRWTDAVLAKVRKLRERGNMPGGQSTRAGILEPYPELRQKIKDRIESLRNVGVGLTIVSIRAIMVAFIQHDAPHLFEKVLHDKTRFRCSEAFVREFLRRMGWSPRKATRAAQKLPENYKELVYHSLLREAYVVRDFCIPADLRVNTDQTQLLYQQSIYHTWSKSGEKQVSVLGMEEKRAFTLVPGISASGEVLPFQAVFGGMSSLSCPNASAPCYQEAMDAGFKFVPSMKKSNYWSTIDTMKAYVKDILVPYFTRKKADLGLPESQQSVWRIDCWSVHRSAEFLTWMKQMHPNITVIFVPGGCTGVFQPLDVGVQRVMKQSMRKSAHEDLVEEALEKLVNADASKTVKLNTLLPVLRSRAVRWIVQAYDDLTPDLVRKAFELCRAGDFNLSHSSITSPEVLARLRELPTTNRALFDEFTQQTSEPEGEEADPQDDDNIDVEDASDLPTESLIQFVMSEKMVSTGLRVDDEDGRLENAGAADDLDLDVAQPGVVAEDASLPREAQSSGRQGRVRRKAWKAVWKDELKWLDEYLE